MDGVLIGLILMIAIGCIIGVVMICSDDLNHF